MKTPLIPVTIRDVARLAGVSPGTVSKVLNGTSQVSAETRERVMLAVDKLGFRPNTIARSLKKNRTLTIGLITDDLEGVFTMSMMRGIEQVTSEQGFSVFLCNSYGQAARERAHLDVLLAKQVEGIILLSGYRVRDRGAPALPLGRLPVVYLYQYTHDVEVPCVLPDDVGGAKKAVEHLISHGRRRIGFINGPPHFEATHLRLQGYREALNEAGIAFDPTLIQVGKWHEQSGYNLTHQLMQLPAAQRPDGLFCASDSIAVGALDALHELGLRIPQDVAVVGFDNRHFSQYQRPPLTTVAIPLVEMGELAGRLLLSSIMNGQQEAARHYVPCELIQRQSCHV